MSDIISVGPRHGWDKTKQAKTKSLFSNDMWKRTSQHFVDHRFSKE